ncbi:MFS transporter [Frigoribacterium salinisoli]
MSPALSRRRLALFALFFVPGSSIASWVTRTPAIRDLLGASTAQMGLVLFGLSVGSMVGILSSGPLVARFSTRPVMLSGISLVVLSMPTVGLGAAASSSVVATAGLALFGLGMGGAEVAMNVDGADLETLIGRSVLPSLHGSFSLGTVVGAVAGIVATATAFPVVWHLLLVGGVAAVVVPLAVRHVPSGVGRAEPAGQATPGAAPLASARPARVWTDGRLLLIGVVVLAMAMAEGTANDWLPLVMVDGHGVDPALGSAVFAIFAAAMTVGRFAGGRFVERYGRAAVLTVCAVASTVGTALVIFPDSQVGAGAGVLLWGLGTSLGFPVALSAAGDSGPRPAARVSFVATLGYVAFLVGPPVLGLVGEHSSLRTALILPMVLVAVAVVVAPSLRGRPVAEPVSS